MIAWIIAGIGKDGVWAGLSMTAVVLATYLASWVQWFRTDIGYNRTWAMDHPGEGVQWLPPALRSLWQYHVQAYEFHDGLTSPHTYQSNPWTWMAQTRPTSFFYESPARGVEGCGVNECSKAITSLGNVSIWWAGIGAILVCLFMWALRRDWRPGVLLALIAAGWLPWFGYQERTIFTFYAVVFAPYVILAVTYCLGLILGPAHASLKRRRIGAGVVGVRRGHERGDGRIEHVRLAVGLDHQQCAGIRRQIGAADIAHGGEAAHQHLVQQADERGARQGHHQVGQGENVQDAQGRLVGLARAEPEGVVARRGQHGVVEFPIGGPPRLGRQPCGDQRPRLGRRLHHHRAQRVRQGEPGVLGPHQHRVGGQRAVGVR